MIDNKRSKARFIGVVMLAVSVFGGINGGSPEALAQRVQSPAQRQAAQREEQSQIEAGNRPDVQIVVMPYPTGKWGVAMVYPQKVSRAEADRRMQRLLQIGGWKGSDVLWENKALQMADEVRKMPGARDLKAEPVMSSLTFQTGGNVVDLADGTMQIEPFARAFRDLSRVHVTYLLAPTFPFRGVRHYSDANLDIQASGQQGAWTYVVNIKNHNLESLNLPRYELVKPKGQTQSATNSRLEAMRRQRRMVGAGLVVVLAAATGMFVWLWTRR